MQKLLRQWRYPLSSVLVGTTISRHVATRDSVTTCHRGAAGVTAACHWWPGVRGRSQPRWGGNRGFLEWRMFGRRLPGSLEARHILTRGPVVGGRRAQPVSGWGGEVTLDSTTRETRFGPALKRGWRRTRKEKMLLRPWWPPDDRGLWFTLRLPSLGR